MSVGLAPVVAIALAAAGPPPAHHHRIGAATVTPAGHHRDRRAAASRADATAFRPGFGGHAGRYVYANARRPHLPAVWLGLALGVLATALSLTGAALRARRPTGGPAPRAG